MWEWLQAPLRHVLSAGLEPIHSELSFNRALLIQTLETLTTQTTKLEALMATTEQMNSALARIDTATSAVAKLLNDYIAQVKAGGMSAADEDAALARLTKAADALDAMGKTAENPVPTPVPPPEPPTEPTSAPTPA